MGSTCPYCGAETRPGDNFCLNCGNRLLPATPSSQQQAQPNVGESTLPAQDGTAPQNPVTPGVKPSPTQAPILICTGAKDNTNVVFSLRGNETSLKQFFDALQPGINWVPAA